MLPTATQVEVQGLPRYQANVTCSEYASEYEMREKLLGAIPDITGRFFVNKAGPVWWVSFESSVPDRDALQSLFTEQGIPARLLDMPSIAERR